MEKSNKPLARRENIVIRTPDDEKLVYDLNNNKAFCLNETSALVWEHCNGKNNIGDIAHLVSVNAGSLVDREMIEFAVDELQKENLLENGDNITTSLSNIPRREAIKRLGLSSALALPLIASLAVPPAAAFDHSSPNANLPIVY